MSTISSSTTSTTAYKVTADTTGTLVLQTGATPTTAVTIDGSQNVGIGTSSPSSKLELSSATGADMILRYTGNGGYAKVSVDGSNNLILGAGTGGAERARIDSSGNLLVGTTSTLGVGVVLSPSASTPLVGVTGSASSGGSTYTLYSTGASAYRFYVDFGGTIHATSIVITAISDQRLKENVRDIDTGLDAIMALKPRRFDWKEGKGQDKKNAAGFIAQEFEEVFPECVNESKAGGDGIEYKSINHETLIPTLVKAIQEQQALITTLKAELDAAKADIATLKGTA